MEDEPELGSSSNEKLLTFAEMADELCPQYMAMGIPYHEYWYGDYTQLEHYRRTHELRAERANYEAWLQGAYIYDALCAVSPVLNAFAKKGTKPAPYLQEPYGTKTGKTEQGHKPEKTEEELKAIQAHNMSAKFASFMTQWNKRLEQKGGELNGPDDRSVTDSDTSAEYQCGQ